MIAMEETTQELLQRLQDNVTYYKPEDWDGTTKEELQTHYEIFKHVSETLTNHELYLLWYLRCCKTGETHRFMRIAQKLCEANQLLFKKCEEAVNIINANSKQVNN